MEFQAPPVHRHDTQVLTAHFQFSGQLEAAGLVHNFVNDHARDCLAFYDVRLAPLTPGTPLRAISHPHIVIRKPQIIFLCFASAETRASIPTLTRRELLVAYTPVAVCRGYFHMPAEANVNDFLGVTPGDLLPITEARVFPLLELPDPFPTEIDVLLLGRTYLQFYHPA